MSCRWTLNARLSPDAWLDASGVSAVYLELVRAGRAEDFRWLARSQGVPEERLEGLWQSVLARLAVTPRDSAGG